MTESRSSLRLYLALAALTCLASRLASLGILDLFDPTEGRYATIAQTMYLTGDWTTPTTFQGGEPTPFLGKPPLQFWLTAISYHLFGLSEFSSRLPSLLATVVTSLMMVVYARTFFTIEVGLGAVIILMSSVMGFFFSAACMTDPLLAAVTAGAYVSFAHAIHFNGTGRGRLWGYALFGWFGLGLLCKGPVALVLFAVGALPWLLLTRKLATIRQLPWVGGALLSLVIASPWYIAAEIKNPGFLNYFLVHENLLRFLVKDYGDKYGSSHIHMRGTIWLMALGAFFPWCLVLLGGVARQRFSGLRRHLSENQWIAYALLWGIAPCVFFTLSRQVSFAYVFPGLAGLALVASHTLSCWQRVEGKVMRFTRVGTRWLALPIALAGVLFWFEPIPALVSVGAIAVGMLLLASSERVDNAPLSIFPAFARQGVALVVLYTVVTAAAGDPISDSMSAKSMLRGLPSVVDGELDFVSKIPQSAYFYSRLQTSSPLKLEMVPDVVSGTDANLVALTSKQWGKMSELDRQKFDVVERVGSWVVIDRK